MSDKPLKESADIQDEPPLRLCSEIQLFDLCDLDSCGFKDGRFCTHADLLARFEAIAEQEDRPAADRRQIADDDDDDDFVEYGEEDDRDEDDYSVFDDELSDDEEREW